MKEYSIKWCDDSGLFWSEISGSKSYFVGDFLQEIAEVEGVDTEEVFCESNLLAILQGNGVDVKLVSLSTGEDIGWEF